MGFSDGIPKNSVQLLFSIRSADMTLTTDQALRKHFNGSRFSVAIVRAICRSGGFLTACAGGLYTAPAKGGSAIVAAAASYAVLTAAGKGVAGAVANLDAFTVPTLYLSLTTGNGQAMTADYFVYGFVVDP